MNIRQLNSAVLSIISILVPGTLFLYFSDSLNDVLECFALVPILVPTLTDLGIVENDDNHKILPYKLAKLNNQGGDLSKRWEIVFSAWSKSENKLVRKRLTAINSFLTIDERNNYAYRVIKEINEMLIKGGHFDKLKVEKLKNIENLSKIKEHVSIVDYLWKAFETIKNKWNGATPGDVKYSVNKFTKWIKLKGLNHLSFEDLKKSDCKDYQKYLLNKGHAGKTINNHMITISAFYNDAINSEIIKSNPFKGIKRIKEVDSGKNTAYSDKQIEEIKGILKDKHQDVWLYCMLEFYCFLRPNEIRQLKIKYVDTVNKKIFIPAKIAKNKKNSYVDMPNHLNELMKVHLKDRNEENFYLFKSKNKNGLKMMGRNSMRDKYKKLVKELGYSEEYTLYSFKHAGVIKAYKAGIDLKSLQKQGRWHSIEMVDKYLKTLGLGENKEFISVMNLIEV